MDTSTGKTTFNDSRRIAYLSSGKNILNFHTLEFCANKHCPVHHPREHEYSDLPLSWIAGSFVRLSPQFKGGIMIDPDDWAYNSGKAIIIKNSAYCRVCDMEVVSKSQHDAVECKCGNIMVDGGHSYLRRVAKNTDSDSYYDTSISFKKDLGITIP